MRFKIYALSMVSVLIVVFSGCSVADPNKTLNPVADLPGTTTPPDAAPVTPVLVSEPMPVVSAPVENSPESAPTEEQTPTMPVAETPPTETPIASAPEYVPVTQPESTPVATPETVPVTAPNPEPPSVSAPPEVMPEPIAIIEETPTSPEATLIDATEIVNVSTPVSSEPVSMTPEAPTAPVAEPVVETPIPPAIMEVVEISNPTVEAPTPNPTYENEEEEDNEFVVSGTCLGKKSAGVVWYDNRAKNKKQNTSVKCKNNKFEIKIKDKKKNLPFLEVQTLFFD